MKKVLIITYYWPPAGGPGVQRWLKLAKYLPEAGVQPFILTVDPEQATYPLRDESLLDQVPDDIEVIRTDNKELFNVYKKASGRKEVPFSGFANESDKPGFRQKAARFARGNFFLPDARKSWNKFAYQKALEVIEKHNIEAVITTSPPHSTQLVGLKLKKKLGIKWIADFRDPWTDIYYYDKFYPTGLARKLDQTWEARVLENADTVVTVSADLKKIFAEKSGKIDAEKIKIVPNGFDPDDFDNKRSGQKSKPFTILYAGTITEQYPLQNLLDQLKGKDLRLRFIGRRDQKTDQLLQSYQAEIDISLEGYMPKSELNQQLQSADALLLIIPDIAANKGILTGKLFDYMGSATPIIAIGPDRGDAGKIILETRSGKYFAYYEDGIADYLTSLESAKPKAFEPDQNEVEQYSRKKQAASIAGFLKA